MSVRSARTSPPYGHAYGYWAHGPGSRGNETASDSLYNGNRWDKYNGNDRTKANDSDRNGNNGNGNGNGRGKGKGHSK